MGATRPDAGPGLATDRARPARSWRERLGRAARLRARRFRRRSGRDPSRAGARPRGAHRPLDGRPRRARPCGTAAGGCAWRGAARQPARGRGSRAGVTLAWSCHRAARGPGLRQPRGGDRRVPLRARGGGRRAGDRAAARRARGARAGAGRLDVPVRSRGALGGRRSGRRSRGAVRGAPLPGADRRRRHELGARCGRARPPDGGPSRDADRDLPGGHHFLLAHPLDTGAVLRRFLDGLP